MGVDANWRNWARVGLLGLSLGAAALGCTSKSPDGAASVEVAPVEPKNPTLAINNAAAGDAAKQPPASASDRLERPFADACTVEINADSGVALPPTLTLTQKNTGQLNEDVQKLWNTIKFSTPDGKKQTYLVEFTLAQGDRSLGAIEILMSPDLAPNHARNFVVLATLKYYDGLLIDRVVRQQGDGEQSASKLVLLEAGSPVESADPASSHLGYWLHPEFSETAKHEEGTIGACLLPSEDNAETAACRFYLNLTAAPAMDGNFTIFGRVSKGIEVARRIADLPIRGADAGPDQGRPIEPIVIRSTSVRAVPVVE